MKHDDPTIINASRAHRVNSNTLRHRYVLRINGDGFVTHCQVYKEDGTWFFLHGNYFEADQRAEANDDFMKRKLDLYRRYPKWIEDKELTSPPVGA